VVVDRVAESLFAPQVAFRRLHRNMTEQKLNLPQFTASLMAQTGTSPAEEGGQRRLQKSRRGIEHAHPRPQTRLLAHRTAQKTLAKVRERHQLVPKPARVRNAVWGMSQNHWEL